MASNTDRRWLRIPTPWTGEPSGGGILDPITGNPSNYVPGPTWFTSHPWPGFIGSLRFHNPAFDGSALAPVTKMARRFAYAAWRINSIERWWDITVTKFMLRDRLTQEEYELDTAPSSWIPEGDWYSRDNLESLLELITDQIRNGGPSGKGASTFYIYSYIKQLRDALLNCYPFLWHDPPDGPGLPGALYGACWNTLTATGDRDPLPPAVADLWTKVLTYGGMLPGNGFADVNQPPNPDAGNLTGVKTWDYGSGEEPPQGNTFYMLEERLKPDPIEPGAEVYTGWSRDHFRALRFREGTTSNANWFPADTQILSEFNLTPHTMPYTDLFVLSGNGRHQTPADYLATHGQLANSVGYTFWCDSRPFVDDAPPEKAQAFAPVPSAPLGSPLWLPGSPLFTFCGHTVGPGVGPFISNSKRFRRLGVETDINGETWKGTIWDWLCWHTGAVPDSIHMKGEIVALSSNSQFAQPPNQGALDFSGQFSYEAEMPNDEHPARLVMDGTPLAEIVEEISMTFQGPGSHESVKSFDHDWTEYLQEHKFPLYLAATMYPAYSPTFYPANPVFTGPFFGPHPAEFETMQVRVRNLKVVGLFEQQEVIFASYLGTTGL